MRHGILATDVASNFPSSIVGITVAEMANFTVETVHEMKSPWSVRRTANRSESARRALRSLARKKSWYERWRPLWSAVNCATCTLRRRARPPQPFSRSPRTVSASPGAVPSWCRTKRLTFKAWNCPACSRFVPPPPMIPSGVLLPVSTRVWCCAPLHPHCRWRPPIAPPASSGSAAFGWPKRSCFRRVVRLVMARAVRLPPHPWTRQHALPKSVFARPNAMRPSFSGGNKSAENENRNVENRHEPTSAKSMVSINNNKKTRSVTCELN
mmetsp:Transcript_9027/g.27947  ORF Transcript_9027/g.27947 Transcript_9027/m.27947 type:complete len:268 (-) Transcript_9027:1219-2022(-)